MTEAEVRIELCGRLADGLGREITVGLPEAGVSAAMLLTRLASSQPLLASAIETGRVRVCANETIVSDHTLIMPGDEVALFPPVSGG